MSTLKVDFNDVVEPRVLDADSEVGLRIIGVKCDNDKNGNPYIMPRFEVVGEVGVKEFTKFYSVPGPHIDDAKKLNNAKYALLQLYKALGIDPDGEYDPEEDFIGLEGTAILGVDDDPQYGEQNYIKRWVVPA